MSQNRLFNRTRWRLALLYAGSLGLILSLLGYGLYQAIVHAHWVALDRELESVAGTLHDSLELKLQQPGRLEPEIKKILPNLCFVGEKCLEQSTQSPFSKSTLYTGNYYIRLFSTDGKEIAVAGAYPGGLSFNFNPQYWQIVQNRQGMRYHQISLLLHTENYQEWGYMQVGRNLQDIETYINNVTWIIGVGLPTMLVLVGICSWWLADLAMQPIYQSYRQIQQFTADAAHELRTPLAAIRANIESTLMLPLIDEIEARETLKVLNRQNQRLSNLVADLLMLCRLDWQLSLSSSPATQGKRVSLNDLVTDVTEELASLALTEGNALNCSFKTSEWLEVMGDADRLYRLVSNLTINAIQYTPTGGNITLILEKSDRYALIHVQDTGVGISPQEQTRIFDRFYRVDKARSRILGGSGLGLSIAQAIAKAHQGTIRLQSELYQGSTFTLRLPLA